MAEIKNLSKAAKRIGNAIQNKERIILYGDSDLDGVCSVLILKEAIQSMGGTVAKVYFPNRELEGYGLTLGALEEFKDLAPALLVIMDLGITNFVEIALARKNKFEVIVLDHHEVIHKLPKANIIVDPKQPADPYGFKGLAACGVTFRVAEKLLGANVSPLLRKSLIELVTIGTIADMMPREDENVALIQEGLQELDNPLRPSVKTLFSIEEFAKLQPLEMKITQMISMLNVREIEQGLPASFRFLSSSSNEEVLAFAKRLIEKNKLRKEAIIQIVERIKSTADATAPCIFAGDASFDYLFLGSVASIISQEYRKPAFIYKVSEEGSSIGSVRAPNGYDTVKAMEHCEKLLLTFGGHAKASGFRIKNENLERFKECLYEYFLTHIPNA